MKIIPTLFEIDPQELARKAKLVENDVDLLEVDIADGKLVDGETFLDLNILSKIDTPLNWSVHLMVSEPMDFLEKRIGKVVRISTQIEAKANIDKFINRARDLGYQVGVSLNPETPATEIAPYLNKIDFVQFMTIAPGGRGRTFKEGVLTKVQAFEKANPDVEIQVDGGVNETNLELLMNIGVDMVVVNTAIFDSEDPAETLQTFKQEYERERVSQITPLNKTRKIQKVAFLGGAGWEPESDVFKDTFNCAKLLAQNGYEIVNGGGPGVMEAATKGAHAGGGKVLAITYHPNKPKEAFEGIAPENDFDEEVITLDYFDRTKVMLQNSDLHIVFKGATGTISEFGMTWASSRIHRGNHKPIILFGSFWKEILETLANTMRLRDSERELLEICKSPEEVLEYTKSLG
ncbi:LOG family protein [bacterium]|nr:LOG family protein [bacterium]